MFISYLLVFPEVVIKTLHWEYEDSHCAVQKPHTFMKEQDWFVFYRIIALRD